MADDDTASKLKSLAIDRDDANATTQGVGFGVFATALILVAALAGGGVWFWTNARSQPDATASVQTAPAAQSTQPTPEPTTPTATRRPAGSLVASGYVTARRQATVSSDITGRIMEILNEEGDEVEEGQILAKLDDARARIDLELAKARVRSAQAGIKAIEAQLTEARRVLAREERLLAANVTADARATEVAAQVDGLVAQIDRAVADAAAAQLDVASRQDLVERHLVRAPFSGVVIDKNAQAGEIVSPTSAGGGFTRTGIYTLVDMDSLEIEVDVNEGSIGRIFPGQKAEAILDAYPDWRIPARVAAIIPTADRSRGTIQVRVAFEQLDPRILPDMAAKVTFTEARNGDD